MTDLPQAQQERIAALAEKLVFLEKMRGHLRYTYDKVTEWWRDDLSLDHLSEDQLLLLAAFKARFAELQDHLSSTMKLIAEVEQEDTRRFTYVVNYMEQLGIVEDMPTWFNVRELRNKATHDYSASDADKTAHFVKLLACVPYLFKTLDALKQFIERSYLHGMK